MIRLTKIFSFETAHALYGYDGKCKNIHGHSYQLFVTVKGMANQVKDNPKRGMVMDFSDLKSIVNQEIIDPLDHAIVLEKGSPYEKLADQLIKEGHTVVLTDYTPTCENMLSEFAVKIQRQLPEGVTLEYLKLHETQNSYGEWYRTDQ